ncbi:MAG: hypothetical protein ACKPKO_21565 [Candidatus Fonsibacter sp.]
MLRKGTSRGSSGTAKANPDKIVVATGDTDQLECIDCITNQNNYDEYDNKCVDMIFPVGMFLKENKRLKSNKDKDTLKRFKRDIFDETIPASQTIGKYFRTVKDINTKYNLAYRVTGGVLVCQVVLCIDVLDRVEVFADGLGYGYAFRRICPA